MSSEGAGGRFLGRSKAVGGSNRFYECDPHTLTALGGFLIPGWDIVLNFTTREWERDGLGRLVMEIYKFSPPTRSKR